MHGVLVISKLSAVTIFSNFEQGRNPVCVRERQTETDRDRNRETEGKRDRYIETEIQRLSVIE